MIGLAQGVAELQRPKLKAAYYRQRHLQQRAGLGRPERPPGRIAPFEAALLKLGEESGKLEECLNLLAEYFAAEQRVMLEVVRKATYPMFVALAATFIAPLPVAFAGRLTAYFLTFGAGLAMWLVAGGSLLIGVTNRHLRKPRYVTARLLRALVMAIEAGLPQGRSLELAVQAADHPDLTAHVRRQGALAIAQQPLSRTLSGAPLVPREVVAALEVAEDTGNFSDTLGRLAVNYEAGGLAWSDKGS